MSYRYTNETYSYLLPRRSHNPLQKNESPHYKSASIIFHYPHHLFTQKKRAYRVSFDNSSPLLETWQDTEGLLAFFRALTSNPVLTKAKRMEKSNNYGI
jgi:nitrate reductase assembly molybdenum cofactor insertion protein NarJ